MALEECSFSHPTLSSLVISNSFRFDINVSSFHWEFGCTDAALICRYARCVGDRPQLALHSPQLRTNQHTRLERHPTPFGMTQGVSRISSILAPRTTNMVRLMDKYLHSPIPIQSHRSLLYKHIRLPAICNRSFVLIPDVPLIQTCSPPIPFLHHPSSPSPSSSLPSSPPPPHPKAP